MTSVSSSSSLGFIVSSELVTAFSEQLNDLAAYGDSAKALGAMEMVLTKISESLQASSEAESSLVGRVTDLKEVRGLVEDQKEMKRLVENKIAELKPIVAKEQQLEVARKLAIARQLKVMLCLQILTEMSLTRITSFIDTVEGFYRQASSKGSAPNRAILFALGKGVVRSMIILPDSDVMNADAELQKKIEEDPELKAYMCAITGDLVVLDGVYLREDAAHNPRERYHDKAIRDWIIAHQTDPIDRAVRDVADIKLDLKGRMFVENKLLALYYPELTPKTALESHASLEVEALYRKSFLLAIRAAYPLIKKKCEKLLSWPHESPGLIREGEALARETIGRFISLVEGVNLEKKEVAFSCFSLIEELLRQAELRLTDENLESVRAELIGKLDIFIAVFREVDFIEMTPNLKLKILGMAGKAVDRGATLKEVLEEVKKAFKGENEIRESFPGCLLGEKEWMTYLGTVEKIPLPEKMFSMLDQPCPITPGKKVGETHLLVLIPSRVNGQALTLNTLKSLVKRERSNIFFDGFRISASIKSSYGDNPTGPSHYVLMTKDVLFGSRNKSYAEQLTMVADLAKKSGAAYRVPRLLPAITCIYMHYLASKTQLFGDNPSTLTRCQEKIQHSPVLIGGFAQTGFEVTELFGNDCDSHGIAAQRRFEVPLHW